MCSPFIWCSAVPDHQPFLISWQRDDHHKTTRHSSDTRPAGGTDLKEGIPESGLIHSHSSVPDRSPEVCADPPCPPIYPLPGARRYLCKVAFSQTGWMKPSSGHSTTTKARPGSGGVQSSSAEICQRERASSGVATMARRVKPPLATLLCHARMPVQVPVAVVGLLLQLPTPRA